MSTSSMMGFACPFHVASTVGETGRVRDFLMTRPLIRCNVSVAEAIQVLPASARPHSAASSPATANTAKLRILPSPFRQRNYNTEMLAKPVERLLGFGLLATRARRPALSIREHRPDIRLGDDR